MYMYNTTFFLIHKTMHIYFYNEKQKCELIAAEFSIFHRSCYTWPEVITPQTKAASTRNTPSRGNDNTYITN